MIMGGEDVKSQKKEWHLGYVDEETKNPQLQNLPLEEYDKFIANLSKNKTFSFYIKDMNDGKYSAKPILKNQGINAILTIPFFLNDEFIGFIGLGSSNIEKEWSQVEIELLESFILLYTKALERNLIEKCLIQVNENFEKLFNMINDLLFIIDFEHNIIDVNNNILDKFKYSKEELIGKSISVLYPKENRNEVKMNIESFRKGKIQVYNMPAVTKSGHVFPVETNVSEGIWKGKPVIFGVSKDISELSRSEEKFSKVFNESSVNMFISRFEDGKIIDVNKTFLEFLGYRREEIIGKTILELELTKGYEDRELIKKKIKMNKKIMDLEIEIRSKDKKTYIGLTNISLLNINREKCFLVSVIDITDRVEYEQNLLEASNKDFLTGAYNRNFIWMRLEEKIEEYKRSDNIFSIGIIDIDDFKLVNDKYGHQVGDEILIGFSKIINNSLRSYDVLGRYGGEEFIIIFNQSNSENSKKILERILKIIRNKVFQIGSNQIKITFSAGIISCEELGKDKISINDLVEIADKRMYLGKKKGKNRNIHRDE